MLLVTVIFAFILAANGLDCVWLKNQQGAGKLTSLMNSPSGSAQFHFNKKNPQAKYIEIHLFDSLGAHTKNMSMIINIRNYVVEESSWVSLDNLHLIVLFTSSKDVESANQTKYSSFGLKANVSFHMKGMLLVYTSEGSFIFTFKLSADQATLNPTQVLNLKSIKQQQGKFKSYFRQRQQTKLLYLLISVFIMASDIYYLVHYGRQLTQFRLSRTASTVYLFSEVIYIQIIELSFQSKLIRVILQAVVIGKYIIFIIKIIGGSDNSSLREYMQDAIIMVVGLTLSYSLYFFVLVYCIIRDTQTSAQMEYTWNQRWLSHCKTLSVILYMPAFKLIYNIPTGFPFDSAIFWWSYLFMLVYLSSICEINYQGGVKVFIRNAKYILSTKVGDYCRILQNKEVKNGKNLQMAEGKNQFGKMNRQQCKQMKQKFK